MIILLTSPAAIQDSTGNVNQAIVDSLKKIKSRNHFVAVVSNRSEPSWFKSAFDKSGVKFIREVGRQNGNVIKTGAEALNLNTCDVLVLAASNDDIIMAKNGGAIAVAAQWSSDRRVRELGVGVQDGNELEEVAELIGNWDGGWWYKGDGSNYSVRALADLSTYGKTFTQEQFAKQLTNTVKNGGSRLTALLSITARSLLISNITDQSDLVWGVYPSSRSLNNDTEILSDFTHRLRTTTSRVRFALRNQPLFLRHTQSAKRSAGGGVNRTDPTEQIQTIHLNPHYRGKLHGRNAIIIDDCTTYGISFAVASAFLHKAGAASCSGVALGKFGNQIKQYDLDIHDDPFAPVTSFSCNRQSVFDYETSYSAQQSLSNLI